MFAFLRCFCVMDVSVYVIMFSHTSSTRNRHCKISSLALRCSANMWILLGYNEHIFVEADTTAIMLCVLYHFRRNCLFKKTSWSIKVSGFHVYLKVHVIALYINGSCTVDFCGQNLYTWWLCMSGWSCQNDDCTSWVQVQEPSLTHIVGWMDP